MKNSKKCKNKEQEVEVIDFDDESINEKAKKLADQLES